MRQMDDYIRRSDVLELAREYYTQGLKEKAVPVTAIRNIPSADVAEVRHGTWLAIGNTGLAACKCGYITDRYSMCNFCPGCGADMRGGT